MGLRWRGHEGGHPSSDARHRVPSAGSHCSPIAAQHNQRERSPSWGREAFNSWRDARGCHPLLYDVRSIFRYAVIA